jgi:hypothetical protein
VPFLLGTCGLWLISRTMSAPGEASGHGSDFDLVGTPLPILPSTVLAPQKSALSASGTSASCPGYHWMFSAQASSSQLTGPPPLP